MSHQGTKLHVQRIHLYRPILIIQIARLHFRSHACSLSRCFPVSSTRSTDAVRTKQLVPTHRRKRFLPVVWPPQDNERVRVAGLLDTICFDKTGTLTDIGLEFGGAVPVQHGRQVLWYQHLATTALHALRGGTLAGACTFAFISCSALVSLFHRANCCGQQSS